LRADLVIQGYRLLEPVGHGGFSTVYLAHQEIFDRQVAVKVLHADLRDEDTSRRFLRECRVTGRLSGHPAIITVYDAGITLDHRPYLAMEYLPGGSLAARVRARGPLTARETVTFGSQVAGALAVAHAQGILHRDLKPGNILLRPPDAAVLSDFGIASLDCVVDGATMSTAFTPGYAAPEVRRPAGDGHTVASDIFALGATLYALLTGRAPFGAQNSAEALQRMLDGPAPPVDRADVPAELVALLHRMLAPAPTARPESAVAVATALDAARTALLAGPEPAGARSKPVSVSVPPAVGSGTSEPRKAESGESDGVRTESAGVAPARGETGGAAPLDAGTSDPRKAESGESDGVRTESAGVAPARTDTGGTAPRGRGSDGGGPGGNAPRGGGPGGGEPGEDRVGPASGAGSATQAGAGTGTVREGRVRRRLLTIGPAVGIVVLVLLLPLIITGRLPFTGPHTSGPKSGALDSSDGSADQAVRRPTTVPSGGGIGATGGAASAGPDGQPPAGGVAPRAGGAPATVAVPAGSATPGAPVAIRTAGVPAAPVNPPGQQSQPAQPAPTGPPCGTSSGSRNFDARTNYTASTGTITWTYHRFAVSGQVVDTARYPSTSYAYLHWETNSGSSCGAWQPNEVLLATAPDAERRAISRTVDYGTGQYLRNVWIRSCTDRNGTTCSAWK
jgi:tRNA A-37 threonylcarbamoyl transferase component Bud32